MKKRAFIQSSTLIIVNFLIVALLPTHNLKADSYPGKNILMGKRAPAQQTTTQQVGTAKEECLKRAGADSGLLNDLSYSQKEEAAKEFREKLHQQSFKSIWKQREQYRDLYPDLEYSKGEIQAARCAIKATGCDEQNSIDLTIRKCARRRAKLGVDYGLTGMAKTGAVTMAVEESKKSWFSTFGDFILPTTKFKPTKAKDPISSEQQAYIGANISSSLIMDAYFDATKNWRLQKIMYKNRCSAAKNIPLKGISSKEFERLYPDASPLKSAEVECDPQIIEQNLKKFQLHHDAYMKDINTVFKNSPLLFHFEQDSLKMMTSSLQDTLAGEQAHPSTMQTTISSSFDKDSKIKERLGQALKDGKSLTDLEEIVKTEFYDDIKDTLLSKDSEAMMDKINEATKESAQDYMNVIGESATATCDKRDSGKPYLHNYDGLSDLVLNDIKNSGDLEAYNSALLGYCHSLSEHPEDKFYVSEALIIGGAVAGSVAAGILSNGMALPAIATAAGFTAWGVHDLNESIKTANESRAIPWANMQEILDKNKGAGQNMALLGFDIATVGFDLKAAKKILSKSSIAKGDESFLNSTITNEERTIYNLKSGKTADSVISKIEIGPYGVKLTKAQELKLSKIKEKLTKTQAELRALRKGMLFLEKKLKKTYGTNVDPRTLTKEQIEDFQETATRIENFDTNMRKKATASQTELQSYLKELGVESYPSSDRAGAPLVIGGSSHIFASTDNHSQKVFNRLFKDDPKGEVKVTISLYDMAIKNTLGSYSSQNRRIETGISGLTSIINGTFDETTAHELRHYISDRRGSNPSFLSDITVPKGVDESITNEKDFYDKFLSVDEINTFSNGIKSHGNDLAKKLATPEVRAENIVPTVTSINARANGLVTISEGIIDRQTKSLRAFDKWVETKSKSQVKIVEPPAKNSGVTITDSTGVKTFYPLKTDKEVALFKVLAEGGPSKATTDDIITKTLRDRQLNAIKLAEAQAASSRDIQSFIANNNLMSLSGDLNPLSTAKLQELARQSDTLGRNANIGFGGYTGLKETKNIAHETISTVEELAGSLSILTEASLNNSSKIVFEQTISSVKDIIPKVKKAQELAELVTKENVVQLDSIIKNIPEKKGEVVIRGDEIYLNKSGTGTRIRINKSDEATFKALQTYNKTQSPENLKKLLQATKEKQEELVNFSETQIKRADELIKTTKDYLALRDNQELRDNVINQAETLISASKAKYGDFIGLSTGRSADTVSYIGTKEGKQVGIAVIIKDATGEEHIAFGSQLGESHSEIIKSLSLFKEGPYKVMYTGEVEFGIDGKIIRANETAGVHQRADLGDDYDLTEASVDNLTTTIVRNKPDLIDDNYKAVKYDKKLNGSKQHFDPEASSYSTSRHDDKLSSSYLEEAFAYLQSSIPGKDLPRKYKKMSKTSARKISRVELLKHIDTNLKRLKLIEKYTGRKISIDPKVEEIIERVKNNQDLKSNEEFLQILQFFERQQEMTGKTFSPF